MLFLPGRLSVSAWCLPPVRREAVVLFCWTHGKGTAGTWAVRVCPLHAAKKDGQCSQRLFFKLWFTESNELSFTWWESLVLHKRTAEIIYKVLWGCSSPLSPALPGLSSALLLPAPPSFLYCASLYLLFVGTLLSQVGQCLHTFSFYLYVNVFVFRLSERVLNKSFSSPRLCAHLSSASYIKHSPEISLLSLVCISCIKNLV